MAFIIKHFHLLQSGEKRFCSPEHSMTPSTAMKLEVSIHFFMSILEQMQ